MSEEKELLEITGKISRETGKGDDEIKELIDAKKSKFSGLLTDSGAAFMVAKELGIEIEVQEKKEQKKANKIANLKDGNKNLELTVRVLHVHAPREYEKNGKRGVYTRLLVGDETGEITLTLWNDEAKKIDKTKIERGAILKLKGANVSSYKEQLQLGLAFSGEMQFLKEENAELLPKADSIAVKISDLSEGMENVDVFARVLRVFGLNEFQREGETRKVVNFLIADDSGQTRATAWNDIAEHANSLREGAIIKIEGGYTKKGQQGLELHLGWTSRILEDPVLGFEIPELKELGGMEFKQKAIPELKEGEQASIAGTIIGLSKGKLLFFVCEKCGKKAVEESGSFICEKCGQVKPKYRMVVSATIDDGEGAIRVSAFGKNAEILLDANTADIEKELQEKTPGEKITELARKTIGKEFELNGIVKLNREELEMNISSIHEIEIEKALNEIIERIG